MELFGKFNMPSGPVLLGLKGVWKLFPEKKLWYPISFQEHESQKAGE